MKNALSVAFMMVSLSLAACSNGGGGGGGAAQNGVTVNPSGIPSTIPFVNGHYTYNMSVNGCSTGQKQFNSVREYCDGLLNDALNNGCARDLRLQSFNTQCVGTNTTSPVLPGTMNAMSNARCVVNGSDLKERSFLQSLNPFNPQRRQVMRDILWDSRADRSYDVLGTLVAAYGQARFTMKSPVKNLPAEGVISLTQRGGQDSYLVRSNLGSQIELSVKNDSERKETQVACMSSANFKRAKADLHKIRCVYQGSDLRGAREQIIGWDLRTQVDWELFRQEASQEVLLRLKPAQAGADEKIELILNDLDYDKAMRAETTLNEGLEVRFDSRETGVNLAISCAPASK